MDPRPVPRPGNLRPPWRPGQSGNPAGYSRARRRRDALLRLLDGGSAEDELAEALAREGLEQEAVETWLGDPYSPRRADRAPGRRHRRAVTRPGADLR